MWGYDTKFSGPLVMMLNNTEVFNPNDHLFVTPFENVKKMLSSYDNVILDQAGTQVDIINKYAEKCDWLFSHGMPSRVFLVKRKYLKKIVWRTWGGSRQKSKWDNNHITSSFKNKIGDLVYYLYYRFTYGCSPVIGIANIVDVLDLEQWGWHRKAKLFPMPYSGPSTDNLIENIASDNRNKGKTTCFLVGHQGNPGENHIEIVKKILSYKEKDIKIYLPLSYGDNEYIESVCNEINKIEDERIIVLRDLMPFNNYLSLLSNVDIAIFDERSSMALGNISFLLYFKKTIVLNKESIVKKAFDYEGLPYLLTEDLGRIKYTELIRPIQYPEIIKSDLAYQSYSVKIQRYINLFNYIDGLRKNG